MATALSHGFSVLVAAGLLFSLFIPLAAGYGGRIPTKSLVIPVLAGVAAWYVRSQPKPFTPPGVAVTKGAQPHLHQMVDEVARVLGQEPPHEVHLCADPIAMTGCRSDAEKGSGRMLVLGLPLFAVLDKRELSAVIAHELGHFSAIDPKLGGRFYARRTVLSRDLADETTSRTAAGAAYTEFYLRHVEELAQEQEQEADDLAVKLAGSDALASALLKMAAVVPLHRRFRDDVYDPLLDDLRLIPYTESFYQYVRGRGAAELNAQIERELKRGEVDRFDAHQPLWARVNRLGTVPDPSIASWNIEPAVTLLTDLSELDRGVLSTDLGVDVDMMQELSLTEYDCRRLEAWRAEAAEGPDLARLVAEQGLPVAPEGWVELGRKVLAANPSALGEIPLAPEGDGGHEADGSEPGGVATDAGLPDPNDLRRLATRQLAVELVTLCEVLGWAIRAPIGAPVAMVDEEGRQLWPFELLEQVAAGENTELANGWFRYLVGRALARLG